MHKESTNSRILVVVVKWRHRAIVPFVLLLKRRGFWLELERGERIQIRTEMVEFIALPFPFPSKLKIWSFHVVVVQWRQRNVKKSVMHVQSCCFAHLTYCFLTFPLPSSSWLLKVPINENQETRSRLSNRLLRKPPEDPGSCHASIRLKNAVYTLRYLAGNPSSFFSCSQTPHGQCNRYKRSFL